jgi:excisionase family DNA binding protein
MSNDPEVVEVEVVEAESRRRLYPVAEAARLLGIHRATLYHRAREGAIEFVRVKTNTYVPADEIDRFNAARAATEYPA